MARKTDKADTAFEAPVDIIIVPKVRVRMKMSDGSLVDLKPLAAHPEETSTEEHAGANSEEHKSG